MRKLVAGAYAQVKEMLQQYKNELTAIAKLLLEKEVIYKEDMEKVLGKRLTPVNKRTLPV